MRFDLNSVYGNPVNRTGHFGVQYRGINTVKCPFDYVLYQMIFMEVKPDLIIEIGSFQGGSALYYQDLLDLIGNGAEVHTIDVENYINAELVSNNPKIKRFLGGYQNYDIKLTQGFKNILVIDDGSHQYQDVLEAFKKFSPLVSKDSYYIIEDGVLTFLEIDINFGGGPVKAINEIVKDYEDFMIDRKYCDFFGDNATFNPNGYLKRIK